MRKTHYIKENVASFTLQDALCGFPSNLGEWWLEQDNYWHKMYLTNNPNEVTCKNCLKKMREAHGAKR